MKNTKKIVGFIAVLLISLSMSMSVFAYETRVPYYAEVTSVYSYVSGVWSEPVETKSFRTINVPDGYTLRLVDQNTSTTYEPVGVVAIIKKVITTWNWQLVKNN
jgi:hypothetical protein